MKKLISTLLLSSISILSFSQTINAGSEEFNKIRKEGLSMNLLIDKKYLEKDWVQFLNKLGDVNKSRDVITLPKAKIKIISEEPILIQSKVTGSNGKSTIFWSLDLGGGKTVNSNSPEYIEVENLMRDFYSFSMKKEEIRLAERDFEEAEKNEDRAIKSSEKLKREGERNAKELESLLKKIEDNKAQAIQIAKDKEQNLKDLEAAKIVLKEKDLNVKKAKNAIK